MIGWLRRLRLARRGNIAMMVALLAVPMIGMVAIAVDGARAWLLRSRMSTALDAAALVGARNLYTASGARDADVGAIFWANMGMRSTNYDPAQAVGKAWQSFMGANIILQTPETVDERTFRLTARAVLPTTFARVIGYNNFDFTLRSTSRRAEMGMELALVLDITGSMDTGCSTPSDRTATGCGVTTVPRDPNTQVTARSSNMDLLRLAAADLVNILYGTRETVDNFWVSVVPYSSTINLGPQRVNWLTAEAQSTLAADFSPTTWRGCVEARAGYTGAPTDGDRSDASPFTAPFRPFYYRSTLGVYTLLGARMPGDNDWARKLWTPTTVGGDAITENWQLWRGNYQVGPNVGCPLTPVLPLTASKTTVLDTIQSLRPSFRGGTMANVGLQGGWFTLSPNWRQAWGLTPPAAFPGGLPLDYRTRNMRKVIVMMTDGANNWFDSPNGFPGACSETSVNTSSFPTAAAGFTAPGPSQPVRPVACPSNSNSVQVAAGGPAIANNADYTGYGRLAERRLGSTITSSALAQTEINSRMSTLCTNIKAQGITIYTVILDTSGSTTNAATRTLYEGCASSSAHYFFVSAPNQLRPAFQQIGTQLANLRLIQ
jgi:Flp pilus assembly protein TadG